jgi:hypothetical protein
MPSFWDLLPASVWPTQPFNPRLNPGEGWGQAPNPPAPWESSPLTPAYLASDTLASRQPWDDDRYRQMAADARRASDFARWFFGRPSREPAPLEVPPMSKQLPPGPRAKPAKPPNAIESAPLGPPVPPGGYNEWDKLDRFYENPDPTEVDPGIMAPDPDPYRTLDGSMAVDPQTILTPQFYFRKRVPRKAPRVFGIMGTAFVWGGGIRCPGRIEGRLRAVPCCDGGYIGR